MRKIRVKYRKEGRAKYLSHLDVMRTLQRAIARAGIAAKHTEGFNPHAYLSIALPLSLGYSSQCELMDIVVLDEMQEAEIVKKLNAALPEGLVVLEAYEDGRKVREIYAAEYEMVFEYDAGVPEGALERMKRLFSGEPIIVLKKTKRGEKETDIAPMIKSICISQRKDEICIDARLSAGNESLNPEYLSRAVEKYIPEDAPGFTRIHRVRIYDDKLEEFR